MFAVKIIAFLIVWICAAVRFKKSMVSVLPIVTSALAILLYVLAFGNVLHIIDYFGIGFIVAGLFNIYKKKDVAGLKELLTAPSFLIAIVMIVLVSLCSLGKVVTWWDDINFWACDAKSIFYLDGFAAKYANVSPEFGDYPPGGQVIKWWFLHMAPGSYKEGLAFAGYYFLNMSFLVPLLNKLPKKKNVLTILAGVCLWLFPGIADIYGYYGFCADLTIAFIYGYFLFAVTDRDDDKLFYYGRLSILLALIVIIKDNAFIWAFFGLVFFIVYSIMFDRKKLSAGSIIAVIAGPAFTFGTWFGFCFLVMKRIAKSTATFATYISSDTYHVSDLKADMMKAYLTAFVRYPLHQDKTVLLDISPIAFIVAVALFVLVLSKRGIITGREGKLITIYSLLSGLGFYGVLFYIHITVFSGEMQYLEPSGMIASIERYSAPFTLGTLLFLFLLMLERGERVDTTGDSEQGLFERLRNAYGFYPVAILLIILFTNIPAAYDGLIGYRTHVVEDLEERNAIIDDGAKEFIECVTLPENIEKLTKTGGRVLVIRNTDMPSMLKNATVSYEISPVSAVYVNLSFADAPKEWILNQIDTGHAGYIYAEPSDGDQYLGDLIGDLVDAVTVHPGVLYELH